MNFPYIPPRKLGRLYEIAERYREVHAIKQDDFEYLMTLARAAREAELKGEKPQSITHAGCPRCGYNGRVMMKG